MAADELPECSLCGLMRSMSLKSGPIRAMIPLAPSSQHVLSGFWACPKCHSVQWEPELAMAQHEWASGGR